MEIAPVRDTLDCLNVCTFCFYTEYKARSDYPSVYVDGASSTVPIVAALFGACETYLVPKAFK